MGKQKRKEKHKTWSVVIHKDGNKTMMEMCTTWEEVERHRLHWEKCKWPGRPHKFTVLEK